MNITIPSGTTKRLLTAGKYCPSDILVTAEGSASRLPEGYQELAYIQSSGTQYIDTAFKPNQNTRVVMDCNLTGGALYPAPFGAWNAAGNSQFICLSFNSTQSYYYHGTTNTEPNVSILGRHTLDGNKNSLYVDEALATTCNVATFQCSYPLHLFTLNDAGKPRANNMAAMLLYSCQIYDNGTLIRDYVPCRSPYGVVGLYDLVGKTFYCNAGTGSFVAGAVPRKLQEGYTQVEYIQSSGTQYIDTGFKPNQDTRVVCKAQYTDISGSYCLFGARYSVSERRYDFLVTGSRFYSEYNNNSGSYPTLSATTDVLEIDKNKNVTTVNGVTHSSHNYVAFQAPCNMLLFAENTNNSPHLQAKAKIYYFQIYDNGAMVRDFVPCKNSGGVFGLYDMVNEKFYGNAGSGSFAGA